VVTLSEARSQRRKVRFDTRSLRWATLTVIRKHQIHLPNPSYMEEEYDFVDEEFQEDEFVDEEFKHGDVHDDVEHEDVENPSQGFVDWDSTLTYDTDINDEDLVEVLCHIVVQILILASARIVCNIVYVQVRDRIHRELRCKN
jgi:hypothetical protein